MSFPVRIGHALGAVVAETRLQDNLVTVTRKRFRDEVKITNQFWRRGEGTIEILAYGFQISGIIITVQPTLIEINGKLPLVARLVSGKIEDAVRSLATDALNA